MNDFTGQPLAALARYALVVGLTHLAGKLGVTDWNYEAIAAQVIAVGVAAYGIWKTQQRSVETKKLEAKVEQQDHKPQKAKKRK